MSATDDLLHANAAYAASGGEGALPSAPSKAIAIVACMDARLDMYRIVGLREGEAHVIRNAGGVVTEDALRSLIVSQRLLGTREIVLIHHTRCGMLSFDDGEFREKIAAEVGEKPAFSFHPFLDLAQDVRDGLARVRGCPFLPHRDNVRGFVFDIVTGRLEEIS